MNKTGYHLGLFSCLFLLFFFFSFFLSCLVLLYISELFSLWFSVTCAVSGMSSFSWTGPQVKSDIGWLLSQFCATSALAYSVGSTDCSSKVLWLGWWPHFFFSRLKNPSSHQRHENVGHHSTPFRHQLNLSSELGGHRPKQN